MSTDPSLFPPDSHSSKKSSTSWQVMGMATGVGLMVFLSGSAFQSRMLARREPPLRLLLLGNAVSGLLAGVLALKLISASVEHRDAIRERLDMVAEMNHHIRNALQVIELSAHSTRNEQAIASISQAVNRIERVLRETVGAERRKAPRTGETPASGARIAS